MPAHPYNSSVGRFYWRTVKRVPVIYALGCCAGLAVGVGALCLFGEPQVDALKRIFFRVLGALMLVVYGWWIICFVTKVSRGTWASHCETRIVQFGGSL